MAQQVKVLDTQQCKSDTLCTNAWTQNKGGTEEQSPQTGALMFASVP